MSYWEFIKLLVAVIFAVLGMAAIFWTLIWMIWFIGVHAPWPGDFT